jgi:hypothetical protein
MLPVSAYAGMCRHVYGRAMGPDREVETVADLREAQAERNLRLAQEEFPDWDFLRVFGGWQAVPKGTPVIKSVYLETLLEKLRKQG